MTSQHIDTIVEEIKVLFEKEGGSSYGEQVTQQEHMVQSGFLAEEEGYDNEVIIAAFLHDIGHIYAAGRDEEFMGSFGARRHEHIGAEFLRNRGFSEKIAILVEGHVEAKRYLTYKNPAYLEALSEASMATLGYQGGPMNDEEAESFEKRPLFRVVHKDARMGRRRQKNRSESY